MTNTTDATPSAYWTAYQEGSLAALIATRAEIALEDRIAAHENFDYRDWQDAEQAREFHSHLRSVRVEAVGPNVVVATSRLSEHGAWSGTVSETLDAGCQLPGDLQEFIAAEHPGTEPEIVEITPGHCELRLW